MLRRLRQALRPAVVGVCSRLTLMQDDRRRRLVAGHLVLPLIGRTHQIDGWCMTVDRHDSLGLAVRGCHEVDVESLIADLLSPGDCVLDIGANIGWSTLHAARAVGPSGLVVALEPEIDNFGLLAHNLRANLVSNVIPLRVGAGRARQWRMLALDADNAGGHSMVRPVNRGRGERVLIVAAGDLCSLLGVDPRVVKIDVEGAEPEVVAGLGPLMERGRSTSFSSSPRSGSAGSAHTPRASSTTCAAHSDPSNASLRRRRRTASSRFSP